MTDSRPRKALDDFTALRLQRRRRLILTAKLAAVLLAVSILADHLLASPGSGDDWSAWDHRRVVFVAAVDGQTLSVRSADTSNATVVRLLGIESFNSIWNDRSRQYLTTLLTGKPLTIELQPNRTRDPQGRLLAGVFLDDGRIVNVELARQGLALAERKSFFAYHGAIAQAEMEARKKGREFWNISTRERMPTTRSAAMSSAKAAQRGTARSRGKPKSSAPRRP